MIESDRALCTRKKASQSNPGPLSRVTTIKIKASVRMGHGPRSMHSDAFE